MSNDPIPEASSSQPDPKARAAAASPSYDEIALRAYFIALHRHGHGEEGDPLQDWIEAERQLKNE